MQANKFNWVGDLQWGSTGKGAAAVYLATHYGATHVSTTNLPNAGHTGIIGDKKFISKIIPTSGMINACTPAPSAVRMKLARDYERVKCYIGAGAGFFLERLLQEVEECNLAPNELKIHPRAVVVTEDHRSAEISGSISTKHIASTMQGSAAAKIDKMMRKADVKLARDYEELKPYIYDGNMAEHVCDTIKYNPNCVWMHEGSQGFSLGIDHGSHFPECTSRECTVMQSMADMGVPPSLVGDVIGVMRPYPIRVGNVVENGKEVGKSGGHYDDHHEISWDDVQKMAGYPSTWNDGAGLSELTTVTKRVRRVFTFSMKQIQQAVKINGITKIYLNFANYIDYSIYGKNHVNYVTDKIWDFIYNIEDNTGVKVGWIGTGPTIEDVIEL